MTENKDMILMSWNQKFVMQIQLIDFVSSLSNPT